MAIEYTGYKTVDIGNRNKSCLFSFKWNHLSLNKVPIFSLITTYGFLNSKTGFI